MTPIGSAPSVPSTIRLLVIGTPTTQGNKTGFVRGSRAIIVEGKGPGRQRHKDWRHAVAAEAREWQAEHGDGLITGPVVVRATFGLQKPASAPKRTRTWPIKARSGDVDKLLRSVLDSLTGTILADDSQVVLSIPAKDWSDPPGVVIEIDTVADGVPSLYELSSIVAQTPQQVLAAQGAAT